MHRPGGHQMVVVENLHESLHLGPLGNLLLAHLRGHFAGITINARHQGMAVQAVRGAVIDILPETARAMRATRVIPDKITQDRPSVEDGVGRYFLYLPSR